MIKNYIDSGILETYVMGIATEDEVKELLQMKATYPEVSEALEQLEMDMERIAGYMAITPPPALWDKIEHEINDVMPFTAITPEKYNLNDKEQNTYAANGKADNFIEVESASTHLRVHKSWRWIFAAVFVLGKVFLACAIYFYLENRQAQQQIQELKTELRQVKK